MPLQQSIDNNNNNKKYTVHYHGSFVIQFSCGSHFLYATVFGCVCLSFGLVVLLHSIDMKKMWVKVNHEKLCSPFIGIFSRYISVNKGVLSVFNGALCSSLAYGNEWFHSQYLHTHFPFGYYDINCCCPGSRYLSCVLFYDDHLFNWCICFVG